MSGFTPTYATDVSDDVFAITPANTSGVSDGTTPRPFVRQIYVTGAGDIKYTSVRGIVNTITVPAGFYLQCAITKVWSTGTTATGLLGYV